MIDLYTSPTPNGWKVAMALEELGLDYTVKYVDLAVGEQHEPSFVAMNPNGRIPVIVDHGSSGLTIFDSNAILFYLAEKTGELLPMCVEPIFRVIVSVIFVRFHRISG